MKPSEMQICHHCIILFECFFFRTEELRNLDIPGIRLGACAFISTGASLVLEDQVLIHYLLFVMKTRSATFCFLKQALEDLVIFFLDLLGVGGDDKDFCVNTFLPEIEDATKDVQLDAETQERLFKGVPGMGAKMFYGALWQVPLSNYFRYSS